MESWRMSWREAVAPRLSLAGLRALREGIINRDPALIHGATVIPGPEVRPNVAPRGACGIAYPGWKGDGLQTVGEVQFYWNEVVGTEGRCGSFISWWDESTDEKIASELLPEIDMAIKAKEASCGSVA